LHRCYRQSCAKAAGGKNKLSLKQFGDVGDIQFENWLNIGRNSKILNQQMFVTAFNNFSDKLLLEK